MSFILSVAIKYSQKLVMESFNIHCTLKVDMSCLLHLTVIYTVGCYEYMFQNPVNNICFHKVIMQVSWKGRHSS